MCANHAPIARSRVQLLNLIELTFDYKPIFKISLKVYHHKVSPHRGDFLSIK